MNRQPKIVVFPVLCSVFCLLYTCLLAQNYRCDWNVIGEGGGDMSSTAFRSGTTLGQTAIGLTSSPSYEAFIGFWQIDTAASGIQEEKQSAPEALVTMLAAPAPNPCAGRTQIRYSIAEGSQVLIQLFDLTGRVVSTLVRGVQKPGRYDFVLNRTQHLTAGVYFVKMVAEKYQGTSKLILR